MKLDTVLAPTGLSGVDAYARAADAMGFDALWTAETSHDPYLPLALVAEHSKRIHFGTSIAVAFPPRSRGISRLNRTAGSSSASARRSKGTTSAVSAFPGKHRDRACAR